MLRLGRHTVIPAGIMDMRVIAPKTAAAGGVLTLQPDASAGIDCALWFWDGFYSDTNYGTAASYVIYGTTRPILIKFDLSSLAGKTITAATLYLYSAQTTTANSRIYVYRILAANASWTESGATWNHAVKSTVRWAGDVAQDGGSDAGCSVIGTDISATAMCSISGPAVVLGTEVSFSLDLTEFSAMVSANYGLRIWATWNYVFCLSDHATAGYRPKLVVSYT